MFLLNLERPTLRSSAFPTSLQIIEALRYYAIGSFQSVIGDVQNILRRSVPCISQDVTEFLNNVAKQYICMSTNEDQFNKNKTEFSRYCTISITMQGVCDAEVKF